MWIYMHPESITGKNQFWRHSVIGPRFHESFLKLSSFARSISSMGLKSA